MPFLILIWIYVLLSQVEDPIDRKLCISAKLKSTLDRVTAELKQASDSMPNGMELSYHTQNGSAENLSNLAVKVVATESL